MIVGHWPTESRARPRNNAADSGISLYCIGLFAAKHNDMELKTKNDQDLLSELRDLAGQEKNTHVLVLSYLREVDRRSLHVARGFSSLFAFCTEYLNFTESEAHTRIQAMRLSKEMPAIEEKIRTGELSLTNIAQAQTVFRREGIELAQKEFVLKNLENKSTRAAERTLAIFFPAQPKPEKTIPVSEEFTRIEFCANQELMQKLEKLKQALAHRNFSGRYDLLFEHLADEALNRLFPKNNAPLLGAPQVTKKNRYIPAPIRQLIWKKFDGGCNFTDSESGRRCGSKHGLEIDHIHEYAKGGSNHAENLQLLCPAHNKFKSRESTKPYRKN